jgi:hypothetical protein
MAAIAALLVQCDRVIDAALIDLADFKSAICRLGVSDQPVILSAETPGKPTKNLTYLDWHN